jgi:hypothetical protein
MLGWLSAGIFFLVLLLMPVLAVADTGTYEITNYVATLEPQSDGKVKTTYEQEWKVLSGNIPWITVGLPSNNFSIEGQGGAAAKVVRENSSGFIGVRVDLDRDYQAGQTFKISFTVLQGNVLERLTADKKWRINYTPGWYDRAKIDYLKINLVSPVDYQTYTSLKPEPNSVNNNVISWEKSNLAPSARFNINVESLDGNFLTATAPGSTSSGRNPWPIVIVIIGIILFVALVAYLWLRSRRNQYKDTPERIAEIEEEMLRNNSKKNRIEKDFQKYVEREGIEPDEEGRYYDASYGDYITPAIWAAVIAPQILHSSNPNNPPPPTGGGGGCACACVSCACACACACAGGGAAGCSRKTVHDCGSCSVSNAALPETRD